MSFSSDLKEELSKKVKFVNEDLVRLEFFGYLISSNTCILNSEKIKYSTESEYNINRFSKLLERLDIKDYSIGVSGKTFFIIFDMEKILGEVYIEDNKVLLKDNPEKEENIKALIRGIYLGAGSVNNPESKYHLEMSVLDKKSAQYVQEKLLEFSINSKTIEDKKEYTIYLKEGEEVSKFLAFIGASKSVLRFEEIRVKREMNNKVNRLVNCEAANLNKTINAAVEQIEAIEKLKKSKKFDNLDDNLKEIAIARLENPNMPLVQLGQTLSTPVGKSGANYRLKKIVEIANEL